MGKKRKKKGFLLQIVHNLKLLGVALFIFSRAALFSFFFFFFFFLLSVIIFLGFRLEFKRKTACGKELLLLLLLSFFLSFFLSSFPLHTFM